MDQTNVEWLDQKSLINDPFKGFCPTNLLLPYHIPPNPIFGHELPKKQISQKENLHSWM
jgi:hypothetical protein